MLQHAPAGVTALLAARASRPAVLWQTFTGVLANRALPPLYFLSQLLLPALLPQQQPQLPFLPLLSDWCLKPPCFPIKLEEAWEPGGVAMRVGQHDRRPFNRLQPNDGECVYGNVILRDVNRSILPSRSSRCAIPSHKCRLRILILPRCLPRAARFLV